MHVPGSAMLHALKVIHHKILVSGNLGLLAYETRLLVRPTYVIINGYLTKNLKLCRCLT
jgi:hypothetical protein